MLRDNYKMTFSQISPSEETIERIFEMTEKKRFKGIRKGLIIAIALAAALLCGALTANAATDGALFEGIGHIINGEEIDLGDYIVNHKFYIDEDGNKVDEYVKVDLNDHIVNHRSYVDDNGNNIEEYRFDIDGDGIIDHVEFHIIKVPADNFKEVQD